MCFRDPAKRSSWKAVELGNHQPGAALPDKPQDEPPARPHSHQRHILRARGGAPALCGLPARATELCSEFMLPRPRETGALDMESDGDIATGGGSLFITRSSTIAQIDGVTNALRRILRPKDGTIIGRRIRYVGGSLDASGGSVFRFAAPN